MRLTLITRGINEPQFGLGPPGFSHSFEHFAT